MTQPVGQEVARKLQTGENPLDFVKKNLAAMQTQPTVDPTAALAVEETKRAEAEKPPEPPVAAAAAEPTIPDPFEEPPAAEPPAEAPAEEPSAEEPTGQMTEKAVANFREARKVIHETKTQLAQAQAELKQKEEELARYKTGEVLPDALADKEAEIARLSKYEKILSLKTSREYQDKFVAPLTAINSKLGEIAKDYNIPAETLARALRTPNRAELNRFLSQHFDDVGALEVKQLVTQAQDLQRQAQDAEKEPQNALQQLVQEGEQARVHRLESSRKELQVAVRSIWQDAFKEIGEEGLAQELIYQSDNPEHNKNIVEPIVKHAATEFGKLIKDLVAGGLEKLSPEAGRALARSFLLGAASDVAMETRAAAAKYADEVETNASRLHKIYRPQVGSMAPGAETVSQDRRPMNPTEAGRSLINNVLAKKKP